MLIKKSTLDPGVRLDLFLADIHSVEFSRSKIQQLIKNGSVFVDGKAVRKSSFKSDNSVEVEIHYEEETSYDLTGNDTVVPVLFQDEYLAIIHKPANMTVHPGAGTGNDTLIHSLINQIENLSDGSEPERPGIVHRLDRETEGIMVIAKTNNAHRNLAELFQKREIQKKYTAWVWGQTPPEGIENGYIGRNPVSRKQMVFTKEPDRPLFKEASMSYRTLEQTKYFSKVEIDLHTGRTHQIRATFTALGFPVVGDEVYSRFTRRLKKAGFKDAQIENLQSRGMLLAASRLVFIHPETNEKMDFSLPLPERFFNLY
ncbi:MAG: RluA family pseudouridine synthase [Leptospirales bacterium]